jgi:hypothetical protein
MCKNGQITQIAIKITLQLKKIVEFVNKKRQFLKIK